MSYRVMLPLLLAAVFLSAAGSASALPNLTYYYHIGLTYPLTPTDTFVNTLPVIMPAALPGNANTTYFSYAQENNGDEASSPPIHMTALWVDGEGTDVVITPFLISGEVFVEYSMGPFNVRGGRHTLGFEVDSLEDVLESDETDNDWAHQFIFTPYVLSESTPKTRGAPPDLYGGWSSIVDGSPVYSNCDGFRFSSTGWWNVVTLYAGDNNDDNDLPLYSPSTGPENGFAVPILMSGNLSGNLDAIIVNRNTVGVADYDVGVINYNDGASQFVIEQVVSEPSFVGDLLTVDLETDEYLRIWDTWVGDTGWVSVSVEDVAADGEDIMVGWAEHDATEIRLLDITNWVVTDESGRAWLHRDFTTVGYYGLVIYRNPMDGGLAKTLTVKIEPTPPDLRPRHPSDWHSPLVPTPVAEWIHPIPLPDTLHGYIPETYINYAAENDSPVGAPPVDVGVFQDGMPWYIPFQTLALAPYGTYAEYDATGREFPGGRHTLTLYLDHTESLHELYENNNIWGEQFCWSPMDLDFGNQFSHGHPGPYTGGWETINSGEPIYFNCDGYRLHTGSYYWEGLVLTQGPNSDYDIRVHNALSGVKDGFGPVMVASEFLAGETDYILVNNNVMTAGVFDIGVTGFDGEEPYTVEAVGSNTLPNPVTGTHGPYEMLLSRMLHIYDLYLYQDTYAFRLDNLAGGVDWGIALHSHDDGLMNRDMAMSGGTSWLNGPGQAEWFTIDIGAAGWYGLAVFKAGPMDFDLEGVYELTILQGVSDVHDPVDIPIATVLTGIHPNPFNPQTTINYELAAPATVELDIYDVKGALVRRLVRESMPAGRHAVVWNGQDDAGGRTASGVYLARFSAGNYRDVRKLVMLK